LEFISFLPSSIRYEAPSSILISRSRVVPQTDRAAVLPTIRRRQETGNQLGPLEVGVLRIEFPTDDASGRDQRSSLSHGRWSRLKEALLEEPTEVWRTSPVSRSHAFQDRLGYDIIVRADRKALGSDGQYVDVVELIIARSEGQ